MSNVYMLGIEILVQKIKQILIIIVKTQPRVADLKSPVNEDLTSPIMLQGV